MNSSNDSIHEKFRFFFEQYYQRLCSYAFSFLKDEESCEDIVQDTFIKIWENRKDLISLSFICLPRFAINCITKLKKNKKYREVEMNDEVDSSETTIKLDPEEPIVKPVTLIAKALDHLPPKCRDVFLLSRD